MKGYTLNRSMKTVLIVILLASMMIFTFILSLTNASTVEQVFFIGDETKTVTLNLQASQTVTGSFNITGEGRYDPSIDFSVIDPNGVALIDSKGVLNGKNFTFKAFTDGEHKLIFDNYGGYDKYIELAYDVSSPSILGIDPLLFSGIVIAIGAVLAILAFTFYRRSHARQRTTQSPIHSLNLFFNIKTDTIHLPEHWLNLA
jgi:hypothetical protein